MIFLNAWAWGLLGLAGVIAGLYFLRRREERVIVSALWLWQQESEHPRSALIFLWTKIWLLFVQLAALAALVFAVAAPTLPSQSLSGGTLALIIDGSASMQAPHEQTTRYERAIEIAQEIITRRHPRSLTVIQAQKDPQLLVPWTESRDQALSALRAAHPTLQGNARESSVLHLLRSQRALADYDAIFYISDHRPEALTDIVTWVPMSEPRKNLAITGFAARLLPESAQGVALWASVENFSSGTLAGTLKLFAEDVEITSTYLRLDPGERRSVEALAAQSTGGRFRAALDADDDFRFDNARYALIPARPKVKILWLGERNFFLERALAIFSEAEITALPDTEIATTEDYDLIIAHNTEVSALPSGRFFFINSSMGSVVQISENSMSAGALQLLQPAHPLVQNVRLEHLHTSRLHSVGFALPVQTLIASEGQPILAAHRSGSLSFVWLGIDLKASPVVLTPSFPILVQNALRWLLAEDSMEQFVSEEFPTPGFTAQGAVNLDPVESREVVSLLPSPPAPLPSEGEGSRGEGARGQGGRPLWHYGAWLALGLLVFELLWYDRRLLRRSR